MDGTILTPRSQSSNHFDIIDWRRPEEARSAVSKDGHKRDDAGAILRDALAALGLLRMRSVVDALLKRRDDVGKVFLDHLVDAEERRPADK
jgi:hypothetical protein